MKRLVAAVFVCLLGFAFVACESDGPLEEAGEKMDDAAKDAHESLKEAGERLKEGLERD